MADFDDLIPKSSDDNPFANPFAGVGRPRSPDPWSLGASYYEQPQSGFETSEDFNEPYGSGVLNPHESSHLRTSFPSDGLPESADAAAGPLEYGIDQHDTSSSPREVEAPPAVMNVHTPPTPRPTTTHTSEDLRLTSDTERKLTIDTAKSDTVPPHSEVSNRSHIHPENVEAFPSAEGDELPQTSDLAPPSIVSPSPRIDVPDESISPRHNIHTASFSPTAAAKWGSVSQPSLQKHDRIVSPLLPSNHPSSLERSFNSLTLGGTAPGWGVASLDQSESPYKSYGARLSTDGEDDDDKPLGIPVNRDPQPVSPSRESNGSVTQSSATEASVPLFHITVGDPQKVGDPIKAHIVYTVSTRTTAPESEKSTFSVLRRYSDFLWLFDALSSRNPGVIIPPVPEKMPFGRFAEGFIESRRLALNKCIQRIAAHPRLRKDPDLLLFLESDSFAMDVKHRKPENERAGLMASIGSSITGPKFYETDEWFDKKKSYLDALESQLRSLSKAIEVVAKQRSELITSIAEFADSVTVLSSSDLSQQLSSSLSVMADAQRQSRELLEVQSKQDLETISGTVEEYLRMIASVRLAFASRVKLFYAWKSAEAEKARIRSMHEKTLRQRGLDRQSIIPLQREIEQAESKAQDSRAEYDEVTKLIKIEVARFEHDRIVDFKSSLDAYLEGVINGQTKIIDSWVQYQQLLLKRANAYS